MGCGKTTLDRELERLGYVYIDFDHIYHDCIQENWKNCSGKMVDWVVANLEPGNDYIIDGWFTWHVMWWLDQKDTSIQSLTSSVTHTIRLVLVVISKAETLQRYEAKEAFPERIREFRQTYDARWTNLLSKVGDAFG